MGDNEHGKEETYHHELNQLERNPEIFSSCELHLPVQMSASSFSVSKISRGMSSPTSTTNTTPDEI